MQPHEIENWALQIVDRVSNNQPLEDSRVELKAEWIDPIKAARRIAGHANAARGASILWLIGIDETSGIVGASPKELANWFAQIQAQFNGLAPQLTDVVVPVGTDMIVALFFETIRRPFLVKNPVYGQKGGGAVALEVPWREGTKTKSATRDELIRLLSPLQALPKFEVLSAVLFCREVRNENNDWWYLRVDLYVEAHAGQTIVIPFHRCTASITISEFDFKITLNSIHFAPPYMHGMGQSKKLSKTIDSTQAEVLIDGPGKVTLTAETYLPFSESSLSNTIILVDVSVFPTHAEQAVPISTVLIPKAPEADQRYKWVFGDME